MYSFKKNKKSQLIQHRIFKILVSTPHNSPLIMGVRHKNFEDPMLYELKYRVNKFLKLYIFLGHTLVNISAHADGGPSSPCAQA